MSAISGIDIALWDLKGMHETFLVYPSKFLYAAQIACRFGWQYFDTPLKNMEWTRGAGLLRGQPVAWCVG